MPPGFRIAVRTAISATTRSASARLDLGRFPSRKPLLYATVALLGVAVGASADRVASMYTTHQTPTRSWATLPVVPRQLGYVVHGSILDLHIAGTRAAEVNPMDIGLRLTDGRSLRAVATQDDGHGGSTVRFQLSAGDDLSGALVIIPMRAGTLSAPLTRV